MIPNETFKASQLESKILNTFDSTQIKKLKDGFEAEVLSPNQSWQKGKVKVQIECKLIFKPDQD